MLRLSYFEKKSGNSAKAKIDNNIITTPPNLFGIDLNKP